MKTPYIALTIAAYLLCVAGWTSITSPPPGERPDRVKWVLPCSSERTVNLKPGAF